VALHRAATAGVGRWSKTLTRSHLRWRHATATCEVPEPANSDDPRVEGRSDAATIDSTELVLQRPRAPSGNARALRLHRHADSRLPGCIDCKCTTAGGATRNARLGLAHLQCGPVTRHRCLPQPSTAKARHVAEFSPPTTTRSPSRLTSTSGCLAGFRF